MIFKSLLLCPFIFSLNVFSQTNEIIIRGLNTHTKKDLLLVKKILDKNFDCKYSFANALTAKKTDRIQTNDIQIYLKESIKFKRYQNKPITIFVTQEKLRTKNLNVAGISYGNQIYIQIKNSENYVENTLTHELSHSFGLDHCSNKCLMSIDPKNYNVTTFCSVCKKILPKYFKK